MSVTVNSHQLCAFGTAEQCALNRYIHVHLVCTFKGYVRMSIWGIIHGIELMCLLEKSAYHGGALLPWAILMSIFSREISIFLWEVAGYPMLIHEKNPLKSCDTIQCFH